MTPDAPIEYVQDYYDRDHIRWTAFPEITAFIDSFMSEVRGGTVLNAGCGPQFYDYMLKFATPPARYVGLDRSRATIEYLSNSQDRRLVKARVAARAAGATIGLICADIFDCADKLAGRFDAVVATGFIGTFHDAELARLCKLLHDSLRPDGLLVKLTWHGPHRTPDETAEKLKFGYDSLKEHEPADLVSRIEAAGFVSVRSELLECDPQTYRWDFVQGCVLRKDQGTGAHGQR